MIANIQGEFYDPVILQMMFPKIVDVSATDYEAEEIGNYEVNKKKRPFIVAHPNPVTLKVETWLGEVLTWTFTSGPYPMLLQRIFHDAANSQTLIQISY
ncbi:MAG: hypothetical protein AB2L24_21915 [Mangrovibacterium sp.]